MPHEIVTVPFDRAGEAFLPAELNRFCLNKRSLSRKTEFFTHEGIPYWSVFKE